MSVNPSSCLFWPSPWNRTLTCSLFGVNPLHPSRTATSSKSSLLPLNRLSLDISSVELCLSGCPARSYGHFEGLPVFLRETWRHLDLLEFVSIIQCYGFCHLQGAPHSRRGPDYFTLTSAHVNFMLLSVTVLIWFVTGSCFDSDPGIIHVPKLNWELLLGRRSGTLLLSHWPLVETLVMPMALPCFSPSKT